MKKYYLAYGSNLNIRQMALRCPTAKAVGTAVIKDYELLFKGSKADKEKSTEKIDGAVATIMALDRAIRCGNDGGASVYDDRGLLFI